MSGILYATRDTNPPECGPDCGRWWEEECPECQGWPGPPGRVYEDESWDPETGEEWIITGPCPACDGTGKVPGRCDCGDGPERGL